jgi:Bacterial conjugation TrbI-like protein
MTDENKPSRVLIEKDGKTLPFGAEGYLRNWNGLKYTLNMRVVKALLFPVCFVVCLVLYFSDGHTVKDGRGSPIDSPGVQIDVPVVESKILVDRDLVNRISRTPVEISPMGGIRVFSLRSLSDLPVGTEAKAMLDSGASNGIVKARLVAPMLVDGEPALPEGTIVFGHGKSTEERLFVEFTKAILPDGESFSIIAQAFDGSDKILGLKGSMVGSKTKKLAMGMALGFMGGMADGLQNTSGSSIFSVQQRPSVRDAALAGTAKATLDQSNLYLDQVKNSPDIIEVKQGTEFYVIVDDPRPAQNQK